jgi:formylmethanofuran dehydrogenase subunit E
MFYSDDPAADFARHDREQTKRLEQLPKCDYCHKPIQDEHYFEINGDVICEGCLNDNFRKENIF